LYVALNIQYDHADAGRKIVEETTLAQNLVKLIADDVNLEIGPVMPSSSGSNGSGSGAGGGSGGGANAAAATTPSTPTPAATTPSTTNPTGNTPNNSNSGSQGSAASQTAATTSTPGNVVTFNLGVQGSSSQLTLFISRVPRELLGSA